MMVFAVMFGAFMYYRQREAELFEQYQPTLNQNFGAANTLVLLLSSLFVVLGMRGVQRGTTGTASNFLAAIGCGALFTLFKYLEWSGKLSEGFSPATNNFFMLYFVLTGVHLLHLIVGIGVLTFLYTTARKPTPSPTRFAVAEGGACYWHMVDLLWIVLFALLYLIH